LLRDYSRGSLWNDRTIIELEIEPAVSATGDHVDKKQSIYLAALSAVYQLQKLGVVSTIMFCAHRLSLTLGEAGQSQKAIA